MEWVVAVLKLMTTLFVVVCTYGKRETTNALNRTGDTVTVISLFKIQCARNRLPTTGEKKTKKFGFIYQFSFMIFETLEGCRTLTKQVQDITWLQGQLHMPSIECFILPNHYILPTTFENNY